MSTTAVPRLRAEGRGNVPTFSALVTHARAHHGLGSSRARRLVRGYLASETKPTTSGCTAYVTHALAMGELPERRMLRGTDPTGNTAVSNVQRGRKSNEG